MLHSLLLLAVVLVLAPLAAKIPHAVLAGILVKVGYDIIDVAYLKRAYRGPRFDLLLMALVLGLTVFVDLISAVFAGVVIAALAFVKQIADEQLKKASGETAQDAGLSTAEETVLNSVDDHLTLFAFDGPLSFGAAADLGHHVRERLNRRDHSALVLDFARVPFIDVSAARAIETIAEDAYKAGKHLYVYGMKKEVLDVLEALGIAHHFPGSIQFETRIEALEAAALWISEEDQPGAPTGKIATVSSA